MLIGQLPKQNNRQILNQQEWAILEGLIKKQNKIDGKYSKLHVYEKIQAKSLNFVCRGAKPQLFFAYWKS
jgi:hypothetical protein